MAKSSFTHNSAQGHLTLPHTGGHGRSSWAQGLLRGRNTHLPVSSLSATPPPKMLLFNYSASSSAIPAVEDTSVIYLKPLRLVEESRRKHVAAPRFLQDVSAHLAFTKPGLTNSQRKSYFHISPTSAATKRSSENRPRVS